MWANHTKKSLNIFYDNIDLDFSPIFYRRHIIDYKQSYFVNINEAIKKSYDLIFIDGPPVRFQGESVSYKVPNSDILKLLKNKPKFIIIDGRKDTVDLVKKSPHFKNYHLIYEFHSAIKNHDYKSLFKFSDFTYFIRKD